VVSNFLNESNCFSFIFGDKLKADCSNKTELLARHFDIASVVLYHAKVCHPDGKTLLLEWSRDRIFDKEVAQVFLTLLKQHGSVRYDPLLPSLGVK